MKNEAVTTFHSGIEMDENTQIAIDSRTNNLPKIKEGDSVVQRYNSQINQ